MTYTAEQLTIIRRIGTVSAEIDAMRERHHAVQTAQVRIAFDVASALTLALEHLNETIRQSDKIWPLFKRHGDLWREFLDTLG